MLKGVGLYATTVNDARHFKPYWWIVKITSKFGYCRLSTFAEATACGCSNLTRSLLVDRIPFSSFGFEVDRKDLMGSFGELVANYY